MVYHQKTTRSRGRSSNEFRASPRIFEPVSQDRVMTRQKYNISAIVFFLDLKRRNRSVGPSISHPPKALDSVEFFHEVNENNHERCVRNSK